MRDGHYHIELESGRGRFINEKNLGYAVTKAMRNGSQPVNIGFVCTYGCGVLHEITEKDFKTLTKQEARYVRRALTRKKEHG